MAAIDHLVYAVPSLDRAIDQFESATGIRPVMGGAHTGLGTHNALVSFGDTYLELIASDPNQSAPLTPRPFGIDELARPTLVTFAIRPDPGDTIDSLVESAQDSGFNPGPILAMSRQRPDGTELHWRLTFPRPEFNGSVPFVIDWGDTTSPASTSPAGVKLTSFELRHPDPTSISNTHDALGLSMVVVQAGEPSLHASVRGPGGSIEL